MKQLLFIFIAAAILVSLPLAGGMGLSSQEELGPARLTVIEKNMLSPTLEELRQKAGDPSRAQAPVAPLFFGERKAQWI